jgi:LytS/YehU family sensor histidine kinase
MSENAKAELELLKSRIHPHFLFNTLNNIYSFILNKSPQASAHLIKLSDMLRYMVTECHQPMVPLEKEITMIQNYFGLEQTRYGNHLDVQVDIKGESREMFIAPLLLIPFVENSFKHGTSKMLNRPWIKLSIDIQHEQLQLSLINSKPVRNQEDLAKGGIGLTNVKKRLRILYPGEHQLKLESASDYFGVYLQVPLIRSDAMPPPTTRST